MATIYVGDQAFIVHHDLVTASSDYFSKALNGKFREKDSVVHLEDQGPATFASYVQWLYNNTVVTFGEQWGAHLDQYILGEYIQDRGYRNAAIDTFIELAVTSGS